MDLCSTLVTEQFLQENVPLRDLLNEEIVFMSRQKSAIKEVNDWALNFLSFKFQTKNYKPMYYIGFEGRKNYRHLLWQKEVKMHESFKK